MLLLTLSHFQRPVTAKSVLGKYGPACTILPYYTRSQLNLRGLWLGLGLWLGIGLGLALGLGLGSEVHV